MEQQNESDQQTIFNTKLLMISSSIFLGLLGIMASFLSQEVLEYYGHSANGMGLILMNITGALYLGFAVLNWMARGNIIGGIYSRPVAIGNFLHFFFVAIALLKFLITKPITSEILTGAIIYSIFAVCFGYILFAKGESCS
ncbi:hypothetical protein LX73_0544 [Fodinibius salinus]|uniref:Uncharacterized protein n=1 Tax=Fodinibius salinus TaxID=860790 RepID=A0A5D3YN82_9BACT|nr:hypothetical protein [Fodinibius salinus]TYP95247.1 hypothetical protein LX73_0544 [Fodinibius salinus]